MRIAAFKKFGAIICSIYFSSVELSLPDVVVHLPDKVGDGQSDVERGEIVQRAVLAFGNVASAPDQTLCGLSLIQRTRNAMYADKKK